MQLKQPLNSVMMPSIIFNKFKLFDNNNKNTINFIKKEFNVKNVIIDDTLQKIEFDTTLTQELIDEGNVNSLRRILQMERKKNNLSQDDKKIAVLDGDKQLKDLVDKYKNELLEKTKFVDIIVNII